MHLSSENFQVFAFFPRSFVRKFFSIIFKCINYLCSFLINRQLAQISRSTRGVILLLGNLQATRRIMTEAHRLNMVGGHFIWLWIDTGTSTGYFHQATTPIRQPTQPQPPQTRKTTYNNASDTMSKNGTESGSNQKSSDKVYLITSTSKPNASFQKSATGKSPNVGTGRDDQSTKVDFSQGFDPFRVMQRQDEQPKQIFNSPQHYQERTAQRDNKQTPANRLILGLHGENAHTEIDDQNTQRSKKIRRSNAKASNASEHSHGYRNRNGSRNGIGNGKADESSNINYSRNDGDAMPIFLSNQTNTVKHSSYSKYRNFSDDNLDEFIDNNNFNENHNIKLNPKRTSTANGSITSSFVNFHQFKDFPVGLLALRPIRMNVDRHFIRAAVRLFAATWEKINSSKTVVNPTQRAKSGPTSSAAAAPTTTTLPQSRRVQPNRNAQATTTLYNAKKFGNEMHGRKMRRKRNISAINQLLAVTMEKRSIKKRSTHSDNTTAVDAHMEHQPVATLKQVNSSLLLKEFSGNSDSDNVNVQHTNRGIAANTLNNQNRGNNTDDIQRFMKFNSSFTSDLPINKHTINSYYANNSSLTNVNVSFNRNFSGLWEENGKNKSNIHSLNNQRHQTITKMVISNGGQPFTLQKNVTNQLATPFNHNNLSTESMAKQASQSVVRNFFENHSQDIRQPSKKRHDTWWSTKKGASATATQSGRPQYDANQLANAHHTIDQVHNNQIKCETPSYFGGCYGTPTAQDIKNAEYFSR